MGYLYGALYHIFQQLQVSIHKLYLFNIFYYITTSGK